MSFFFMKKDILLDDLNRVDKFMKSFLYEETADAAFPLLNHLLLTSGKQLRPRLTLLSFYMVNPSPSEELKEKLIQLAAAVEIIHCASLIHDDVIDEAETRRGQPTIRNKWGNSASVAVGVSLYARALQLVSNIGSLDILTILTSAVRQMCDGELIQLTNRQQVIYKQADYMKVITSKTAALFKAACETGVVLAKGTQYQQDSLSAYATNLGVAFQLTDDILDCFGKDSDLDKNIGQDYLQGQLTLPFVLAMDTLSSKEQSEIKALMKQGDLTGLYRLRSVFETTSIKHDLLGRLDDYISLSNQALTLFDHSIYKEYLTAFIDRVASRCSAI